MLVPLFPQPIVNAFAAMQAARALEIGGTNFGSIDRLIALKFPAYLVDHPQRTLWLIHQYRQLYDLWDEPQVGFASMPFGESVRTAVSGADRLYLSHYQRRFAISNTVARRLRDFCGLDAETLYPPVEPAGYVCEEADDYFLFPARLSVLKRQDLVLRALALTRSPVHVRFIGSAEDSESLTRFTSLAAALGVSERAHYLGRVGEPDKRALYARSIGIVFPPRLEDLGLVTQEAMLASKPVITCDDSGGVLEFVDDGATGIVTNASAEALAEALDCLWADRARAVRLGQAGFERLRAMNLSWPHVIDRLLE